MLILTVRPGERVLVGKDVWITVADVHGKQVRVGFDAPRDVKIVREEVLVREQQRRAAGERL